MSESEKKADRERVRVCMYCRKQITDISSEPARYHIWIAGDVKGNAHCKLNPDYLKNHEPLAEPAEPSGGPGNISKIIRHVCSKWQAMVLNTEFGAIPSKKRMAEIIGYVQDTIEFELNKATLAAVGNPRIGAELADKSDTSERHEVPPLSNEQSPVNYVHKPNCAIQNNKPEWIAVCDCEPTPAPPVPQMGAAFSESQVQVQKRWEFCNKCGHDHCAGSEACADLLCECGKTPTQIQAGKEKIRQQLTPSLPSPSDRERREEVAKQIECREFYEAAQAYRHAPVIDQEQVLAAYKELRLWVADWHLETVAELQARITEVERILKHAWEMNATRRHLAEKIESRLAELERERDAEKSKAAENFRCFQNMENAYRIETVRSECAESQRDNALKSRKLAEQRANGEVWYWMGDGICDHPETITCPVIAPVAKVREWLAAESQAAVLRAALKDIYDHFMAPSACGDFTCYCGNPEVCGICEIRGQTEKLLALTPSPESTEEKK